MRTPTDFTHLPPHLPKHLRRPRHRQGLAQPMLWLLCFATLLALLGHRPIFLLEPGTLPVTRLYIGPLVSRGN